MDIAASPRLSVGHFRSLFGHFRARGCFPDREGTGKKDNAVWKRAGRIVCGNIAVNADDKRFTRINVQTTEEMYDAVIGNCLKADVIIKAAAPCDFKPSAISAEKIKADGSITVVLEKTPDIAAAVGKIKGDRKLVVFAAETNDTEENARKKLKKKNADMVVANDVTKEGAGFGTDTNIATLITQKNIERLPVMSKSALADIILDRIIRE